MTIRFDATSIDSASPASWAPGPYAWIGPETLVRHALASYYAACRYIDQAQAHYREPMRAEDFVDALIEILVSRLGIDGQKLGLNVGFDPVETLKGYTEPCWHRELPSISETPADIHWRALGRVTRRRSFREWIEAWHVAAAEDAMLTALANPV